MAGTKADSAAIISKLSPYGITANTLDEVKLKEVAPGQTSYVWEGRSKHYKALGADHVFTGLNENGDSRKFIASLWANPKNQGLKSSKVRDQENISGQGASEEEDAKTGGANNVFTRLVTKNDKGSINYTYHDAYKGNGYRILFDLKILERTDWYSYNSDNFGSIEPNSWNYRPSADEFVKKERAKRNINNEIMFRRSVGVDNAIGISCDYESMKKKLVDEFHSQGVYNINGKLVEDFIEVRQKARRRTK